MALCTSRQGPGVIRVRLGAVFRLIVNVRRGSSSGMPQAWADYESIEAARLGAAELLRDDRVVRVMIARNLIPPSAVEWVER